MSYNANDFNTHSALMIAVKERIKELEKLIEKENRPGYKQEMLDAKIHNEKILVGLITQTMGMTPPTIEMH
jgi:hypothetical protein